MNIEAKILITNFLKSHTGFNFFLKTENNNNNLFRFSINWFCNNTSNDEKITILKPYVYNEQKIIFLIENFIILENLNYLKKLLSTISNFKNFNVFIPEYKLKGKDMFLLKTIKETKNINIKTQTNFYFKQNKQSEIYYKIFVK